MRAPRLWRRRFIVDDMQYRLLATNVAYFVVGAAIVGAVVFIPLVAEVRDPTIPDAQRAMAAAELLSLHRRFWPGLALAVVLLAAHSILTSHRIAGPLYRFRRVFSDIEGGHVDQQINLRRHDFLVDEAAAINRVLDALHSRDEQLRQRAEELRAELDALQGLDPAEAGRRIAALRDRLDALDALLRQADRDAEAG